MLQYPRKPITLSDDLESFVYILVHCAARFHKHDIHESFMADVAMTPRALAEHNLSNGGELAQIVNHFFFAEAAKGDHIVGGKYKLDCIVKGAPPFELTSPESLPSPLQSLLSELYTLLHEHYAALDAAGLKQYASKDPIASETLQKNPIVMLHMDTIETRIPAKGPRKAPPPAASSGLVPWKGSHRPRLLLCDHDEMSAAIWTAFEMPGGRARKDKTLDQLYGTGQTVNHRPVGASTRSKRKSEEGHQLPVRAARRPRLNEATSATLERVTETENDSTLSTDTHDEVTRNTLVKEAGLIAQNEGELSEMSEAGTDGGDSQE